MRRRPTKRIEQYRIRQGRWGSDPVDGANGAFEIPLNGLILRVVVSDGTDWEAGGLPGVPWEHVSVSLKARCPTWDEMCFVKRIFWREDETVMQLHVPKEQHVNYHQFCLHLWKPVGIEIPLPPSITVGPKT